MKKGIVNQDLVERYFFIDALRVIAVLMVFIYHVNMIFVAEWGWHIKNANQSNVIMEVNYWMQFFRMPLLFFVSGFISCVLLEKLSNIQFIGQRFKRLIIPTIIWTFILVAPQIYFERKLQGAEFNYIEFYKTFLELEWWPNGNFHWLHLWFIPYLFVYNLILIPIFRVVQNHRYFSATTDSDKSTLLFISIFIVVSIIPYTLLSSHYPATYDLINDYARHAKFLPFVLAGLLTYKYKPVLFFLEENRASILRLAFLSIIVINTVRWNGWDPKDLWSDWLNYPISYVFLALLNINSWLWVLAFLGYGKKYLNAGSNTLKYCNSAVFPFYILHQTIIVILGYYVVQTADNDAFKYAFLLVVCFLISVGIYYLYIRPYKFVRLLFGSK